MYGFEVNILAVFVATLFSVALGVVWYSPMVCGKWWVDASDITERDLAENLGLRGKRFVLGFVFHVIAIFFLAYLIGVSRGNLETSFFLVMVALTVLVLLGNANMVLWEKRTLRHFFVTGGYMVLFLWSSAVITTFWPW